MTVEVISPPRHGSELAEFEHAVATWQFIRKYCKNRLLDKTIMETRSDALPHLSEPKAALLPRGNSATLVGLSEAASEKGSGR
jgi:hypothetical protein